MTHVMQATNAGLNVEASFNASGFSGIGANVNPRLCFQVKLNLCKAVNAHHGEDIQAWSFGVLSGYLRIGSEIVADIKTYSVNSWLWGELKNTENNQPIGRDILLNIEIPLDARRLEWIEKQRSGKSLEASLHITLQVQIFGKNVHTPSFPSGLIDTVSIEGDIPIVVPDTHWRERVLPGVGYGKILVIELPAIGQDACKELDHSLNAFNNAQKQFGLGLYDETVASCRVAIEQFFEAKADATGKKVPRLKQSWETKLGAATYQWLDASLSVIKMETNKPHHSPENHVNRLGAQMILMVTTALVSYAAQYYATNTEK